jgi:hypothetical protein
MISDFQVSTVSCDFATGLVVGDLLAFGQFDDWDGNTNWKIHTDGVGISFALTGLRMSFGFVFLAFVIIKSIR